MGTYKVIGGAVLLRRRKPFLLGETFTEDNVNGITPADREARLQELLKRGYCVEVTSGTVVFEAKPVDNTPPPADNAGGEEGGEGTNSDDGKVVPDEGDITREEIKVELTKLGVKFNSKAKTSDLYKLLEDESAKAKSLG